MDIQVVFWDYNDDGTMIFTFHVDSYPSYKIGETIHLIPWTIEHKETLRSYEVMDISHHILEKEEGSAEDYICKHIYHRVDVSLLLKR